MTQASEKRRRPPVYWLSILLIASAVLGGGIAYAISNSDSAHRGAAQLSLGLVTLPAATSSAALDSAISSPPSSAAEASSSTTELVAPGVQATAGGAAFAPRVTPAQPAYPAVGFGVSTPTTAPAAATTTYTPTAVAALSLDQKIGQMMMFGFRGADPSSVIADFIDAQHVGNVVLLGDNVTTPAQLTSLDATIQSAIRAANGGIGGMISVDQEGGTVQRLAPPQFQGLPSARAMAATGDPRRVTTMAADAAAQLRANGINMDLAPVFDVNDNPANPVIGNRAFGTDPATVITFGPAFLQGLRQGGVASVAKHFPGHGNTSEDSHLTLPYVMKTDAQLRAVELPPFATAIQNQVDAIMIDHVVYTAWDPSHPASLSPRIVTGILRDELGYTGVVMTDDMNMQAIQEHYGPGEAAVLAILAGSDIVLTGGPPELEAASIDGVRAAVQQGRIPLARIDASVARILSLKRRLGLMPAR